MSTLPEIVAAAWANSNEGEVRELLKKDNGALLGMLVLAARDCQRRGWFVFPCNSRDKRPAGYLVPHGFKDATNDAGQICAWWSTQQNLNVGIATGASGLAVVDIDKGFGTQEEFESWRTRNDIPETFTIRTGRRPSFGIQMYFAGETDCCKWELDGASGEIKSTGGYVMAAGSVHPDSGASYAILHDAAVAPLPDKLKNLQAPKASVTLTPGEKIPRGEWHPHLISLLGTMVNKGVRDMGALVAVQEAFIRENCEGVEHGINLDRLRQNAESAQKFDRDIPAKVEAVLDPVVPETAPVDNDMPAACFDGWLGKVARDYMGDFPRSYAWAALLVIASAYIPMASNSRCNLNVALVGDPGSGKGAAFERAAHLIGDTELLNQVPGSGEGLGKVLQPCCGDQYLLYCDELGQLFAKGRIENSSLEYMLNALWGRDRAVHTTKSGSVEINARLSTCGGITTEDFDLAFGAASARGRYRRTLFAEQPNGFPKHLHIPPTMEDEAGRPMFPVQWEPCTALPADVEHKEPVAVMIRKSVFEEREAWVKSGIDPEFIEPCLRAAVIAASFDGWKELTADMLEPTLAYLKYQKSLRTWLSPNMGLNSEGQLTEKFLRYLKRYAPNGQPIRVRNLLLKTNAYRFGAPMAHRVVKEMARGHLLVFGGKEGKAQTVALASAIGSVCEGEEKQ